MNVRDLIVAKREGLRLSDAEIEWLIPAFTSAEIADEQMAALLMAIVFQGLDHEELTTWTRAMIESGERLDLSSVSRPTVDKHSTGGVGDKVSLALCPIVAACGAAVPQLSGRGLGHTGGTLDKLEAIPGWRAKLSNAEFLAQLDSVGGAIAAASAALAPADQKLYSLRDVTGTVASIPLIASSIMSKKIAEGTDALVLDVKFGSGAFLPDPEQGAELAETMVGLGTANGVRTVALMTDMDEPLGRTAGNAVEVREAVELLEDGGPADVREVTLALAAEMVALAGLDRDPADAIADGSAIDVWKRMIRAQDGDPDAPLPTAAVVETWSAGRAGIITRIDALAIGRAVWRLGAGRSRKEDTVSATAGIVLRKVSGDAVTADEPLLELHTDDPAALESALTLVEQAIEIGTDPPPEREMIGRRIAAS